MKVKTAVMGAIALTGAGALALAANAQDRMILPGANWATMQDETEGGHRFGNPEAKVKLVEFMSYTPVRSAPHLHGRAIARSGWPTCRRAGSATKSVT